MERTLMQMYVKHSADTASFIRRLSALPSTMTGALMGNLTLKDRSSQYRKRQKP